MVLSGFNGGLREKTMVPHNVYTNLTLNLVKYY